MEIPRYLFCPRINADVTSEITLPLKTLFFFIVVCRVSVCSFSTLNLQWWNMKLYSNVIPLRCLTADIHGNNRIFPSSNFARCGCGIECVCRVAGNPEVWDESRLILVILIIRVTITNLINIWRVINKCCIIRIYDVHLMSLPQSGPPHFQSDISLKLLLK